MVKIAAALTGALVLMVVGASAALADHGSAWSIRQSGVFSGSGGSAGAVQWVVLAILAVTVVWVATRIVAAARTDGGGRTDGSTGTKTAVDRERKPAMSVLGPKQKQPVNAAAWRA
jgi:hypothetical protein